MSDRIAVVVTGDEAADRAAHGWAHWRAQHGDVKLVTTTWHDAARTTVDLTVVGRRPGTLAAGEAGRDLDLAASLTGPLVVVAVTAIPRPATELADHGALPVVVGVPTDTGTDAVLDLAADEARSAGTDVVVERIWRDSDWLTCMTRADVDALHRSRTEDAARLDAAVLHIHHRSPGLDVRAELKDGNVHTWLTEMSHRASLVVLGTGADGHGELAHWALSHVTAPVALVPTGVLTVADTTSHVDTLAPTGGVA